MILAISRFNIEQIAADSTALLAHYLIESRTTHLLAAALDGTIRTCNWRFADSLKAAESWQNGESSASDVDSSARMR